jgi:hypothetical protein
MVAPERSFRFVPRRPRRYRGTSDWNVHAATTGMDKAGATDLARRPRSRSLYFPSAPHRAAGNISPAPRLLQCTQSMSPLGLGGVKTQTRFWKVEFRLENVAQKAGARNVHRNDAIEKIILRRFCKSTFSNSQGHGLPWRPSTGAAGPPQKAAAPIGDRGFRVGPIADKAVAAGNPGLEPKFGSSRHPPVAKHPEKSRQLRKIANCGAVTIG